MRRSFAFLAIAVLVAIGCAPTGQPTASPSAGEKPVAGGRLVVGSISDPKTLQPVISSDTTSSAAWSLVYIGLIRSNKDTGEPEAGLAEKFGLSADALTLTYTLRDGLIWSDGTPFTMDDYKYTAEAVMRSKKTARKSSFENVVGAKDYEQGKTDEITGIQVKDGGKTIEIKLIQPFCTAITSLSGAGAGGILPKKQFLQYWNNKTTDTTKNLDDTPLNNAPPVSMGPFLFKEFKSGVQVSYTRNDKYYRGAPLLDEYIIKTYADATAIKNALLTGEIAYAGVEAKDYDEVSKSQDLAFFRFPRLVYRYLGWGTQSARAPFLKVKEVRQALQYGINIDALVQKVLFGFGSRVYSHNTPVSWSWNEEGINKYPYDVSKAKSLLEKAGAKLGTDGYYRWTDGKLMEVQLETNQGNNTAETTIQYAQEQYKLIGIKVNTLLESSNTLLERNDPTNSDVEGWYLGWSIGTDLDPYPVWHSSQVAKGQFNVTHYSNPAADKAMLDNRNGPDCSKDARKKALHTVDKAINEDAPYTFLFSDDSLLFASKTLRDFQPTAFSSTSGWNIEKWWIKK